MTRLFNAPYPFYEHIRQRFKICLGIGVFIAAFCVLIKPFGLDRLSTAKQLGYGLVSFLVCSFYILLLPELLKKILRNKGWKVYKEMLWVTLIILSLTIANYFYSGFAFEAGYAFDWASFWLVLFYTSLVAVIPAITIILYKQLFLYKKVVREVAIMDAEIVSGHSLWKYRTNPDMLTISSESGNDGLNTDVNDFIFLMSSGNYIEVYYMKDNEVRKKLIRNSISKVACEVSSFPQLVRCHRSYIINLNRIIHVSGNLQGYQLQFERVDQLIPVSRSYTKIIKRAFLYHR